VRLFVIFLFLVFFNANAQKTEKIVFKSANPFALSDIIKELENQQEQEVFGKLTFPIDSFDKKETYPLIIGVAGSFGGESITMNTCACIRKMVLLHLN